MLALAAPGGAQQPAADLTLESVRLGLAACGPLRTAAAKRDDAGRPVFRVHVEEIGPRPGGRLIWDPAIDTAVPSYVRPRWPGPHYEFLKVVTPEEFRGGLTPAGVDVLGIVDVVRNGQRSRAEQTARRRVREELAAFKRRVGIS
jgi:hypothetical protein